MAMFCYDQTKTSEPLPLDLRLVHQLHQAVIHQPAELRRVAEKIENWMRVLGYPGKDIFAVILALREAVHNAVRHGNQGNPNCRVRICYLVTPEAAFVEVEDQGPGFAYQPPANPWTEADTTRPQRRRGLFLMQAYTDAVTVFPPGNRVAFGRKRSPA
jgi:serine/threonine-protein kinase RsbW